MVTPCSWPTALPSWLRAATLKGCAVCVVSAPKVKENCCCVVEPAVLNASKLVVCAVAGLSAPVESKFSVW